MAAIARWSRVRDYRERRPLKCCGRTRNSQGIMIGTARANPGKNVSHPSHLDDAERSAATQNVFTRRYGRSASTCWFRSAATIRSKPPTSLRCFRNGLPLDAHRIPNCALTERRSTTTTAESTFTFGYFTAVDFLARRGPQPAGRRRGKQYLFPGRIDGTQRWLAGVRRRHRRGSESRRQRRRYRRQVSKSGKKQSTQQRVKRRRAS